MLDLAQKYIDMGFSLLALSPNSKVPIMDKLLQPNGSKSSSNNFNHIKKMFELYPKMNLGIATGQASGITVIDIDSPDAKIELQKNNIPDPKTRLHKTPRGWHVIIPYDAEIKQTAALLDKIDIRNDGGYIVCPPSQVDNIKYEVIRDGSPTREHELESFLKSQSTLNGRSGTHRAPPMAPDSKTPDWVRGLLSNGSAEGDRNSQGASLAGYWRNRGTSYDDAFGIMMAYADKCDPPMAEDEVRRTVDSIWRYEPTNNMFPYQDNRLSAPLMDINIANRRVFRWVDTGLMVNVTRISETRKGIDAEITIAIDEYVLYGPVHIDLMSTNSRTTALRALKERKEFDWSSVIQHVAYLVRNSISSTGSFIDLSKVKPLGDAEYLIKPILRHGEPTLLYGHGGTGKSSLALAMALSYATGREVVPGFTPMKTGNVAILDYETTEYEHNRIVENIAKGLGIDVPSDKLFYFRVSPPLTDSLEKLVRLFREHEIDWYILDSVVGACGGDPFKPETAIVYKAVQQELGVACLGVSHVAADNITAKEPKPYGSVYFYDWSRSCWFASHDQEEGDPMSSIGVFQKKGNAGVHPPVFVQAYFNQVDNSITYHAGDPRESESLTKRRAPSIRVLEFLKENPGEWNPKEIAEKLDDIPASSIRSALIRMSRKSGLGVNQSPTSTYSYDANDANASQMRQDASDASESSAMLHPPLKGGATASTDATEEELANW